MACMTLVMALVLTSSWIRSEYHVEMVWLRIGNSNVFLLHNSGYVGWYQVERDEKSVGLFGYFSHLVNLDRSLQGTYPLWSCNIQEGFVLHWIFVLPLAVISAFLFLTQPRQSTPKEITEPRPAEGMWIMKPFFRRP